VRKAVGQIWQIKTMTLRNFTIAIILTIQTLTAWGQECKKLDDAQYFVKHKTKGQKKSSFRLTIANDMYFITRDGKEYPKGKIQWSPYGCMFKLDSDQPQMTKADSMSVIGKMFISNGGYCYELNARRKFRLTYCGNLHITISEGRIIKK
jgi:hypothetical protein